MLGQGANVDVQSPSGKAAIHYAAVNNRKGIIDILLKSGADPSIPDNEGKVAAELATEKEVKELLLREGARRRASNKDERESYYIGPNLIPCASVDKSASPKQEQTYNIVPVSSPSPSRKMFHTSPSGELRGRFHSTDADDAVMPLLSCNSSDSTGEDSVMLTSLSSCPFNDGGSNCEDGTGVGIVTRVSFGGLDDSDSGGKKRSMRVMPLQSSSPYSSGDNSAPTSSGEEAALDNYSTSTSDSVATMSVCDSPLRASVDCAAREYARGLTVAIPSSGNDYVDSAHDQQQPSAALQFIDSDEAVNSEGFTLVGISSAKKQPRSSGLGPSSSRGGLSSLFEAVSPSVPGPPYVDPSAFSPLSEPPSHKGSPASPEHMIAYHGSQFSPTVERQSGDLHVGHDLYGDSTAASGAGSVGTDSSRSSPKKGQLVPALDFSLLHQPAPSRQPHTVDSDTRGQQSTHMGSSAGGDGGGRGSARSPLPPPPIAAPYPYYSDPNAPIAPNSARSRSSPVQAGLLTTGAGAPLPGTAGHVRRHSSSHLGCSQSHRERDGPVPIANLSRFSSLGDVNMGLIVYGESGRQVDAMLSPSAVDGGAYGGPIGRRGDVDLLGHEVSMAVVRAARETALAHLACSAGDCKDLGPQETAIRLVLVCCLDLRFDETLFKRQVCLFGTSMNHFCAISILLKNME